MRRYGCSIGKPVGTLRFCPGHAVNQSRSSGSLNAENVVVRLLGDRLGLVFSEVSW